MRAETARINLVLPSYRFEDLQCLITLFARYRHSDGCENHELAPFLALTQDPRLRLDGFLDKTKLVRMKGVAK
jgi:hypothetical protein